MPLDTLSDYAVDNASTAGHQASAEMMRRLIVALNDSKKSADRWSSVNAFLALAILALTAVLLVHGG